MDISHLNLKAEDAHELLPILNFIHGFTDTGDFDSVVEFFNSIPYRDASILVLMSLMRTTWVWGNKIPNWEKMRDTFMREVARRGEDPKEVFHGLENSWWLKD